MISGEADLLRRLLHRRGVGQAVLGPGDGGDVRLLGDALGGRLVAEGFEQVGGGADEGDAVLRARPGEAGVFREEAVARVDRVDAVLLGDRDQRGMSR
jgi:hypothetical protein